MTSPSIIEEFVLPNDFISFVNSNYEKISLIRQKIQEFYEKSRQGEIIRRRTSISELTSEDAERFSPIITAKLRIKPHLLRKLDTVEIGSDYLTSTNKEPSTEIDDFEDISRKFPLLVLDPVPDPTQNWTNSESLLVEGIRIKLANRIIMDGKSVTPRRRPIAVKKYSKLQCRQRNFKKVAWKKTSPNNGLPAISNEHKFTAFLPSLHEIAWDIYSRYTANESFAPISQMTFPPLHSSVLTLLSQGSISGTKNGTDEGSATKQKKLRRQGRRRKSESHENVDADDDKKPRDNVEENIAKNLCGDKTHERGAASSELENMKNNFEEKYDRQLIISPKMQTSKSTLYQILDERLSKRSWYLSEGQLNREIADLETLVGKTEKTLRTLNLNEDLTQLLTAKEPKKHLC